MNNTLCQHHPDDNLLAEYASGSIEYAQAIAISSHLHFCARCRHKVANFENIAGALLSLNKEVITKEPHSEGEEITPLSFDSLMETIGSLEKSINSQAQSEIDAKLLTVDKNTHLPKVVRKMIDQQKLSWKSVTRSLKSANLTSGQNQYGVYLQKIEAGGLVPEHNHKGDEITVVLKGSISDEDGVYHEGDFIYKYPGDIHRPRASSNEDCLCLSIQQAPVQLTGVFGRLLNPFLRIKAI